MESLLMALHQQREESSKPLLEIKAGRMIRNGNLVEPDKRRGKIVLRMSDDILHFEWFERGNPNPAEEKLILFPGEATFKRVKKMAKDRVYCLELTSKKRYFFWLQEPSSDKDVENVKKINEYIEKPPVGSQARASQQSGRATQQQESQPRNPLQVDQLNQILLSMGIQQIGGTSQGTESQATPSSTQPSQQQQQESQSSQASQNLNQSQQEPQQIITLKDILNSEALVKFLRSQEEWKGLVEHLPEGTSPDTRSIEEQETSPEFLQLLARFNQALTTGQLDDLLRSLGIDRSHLTTESLLNAINKKYGKDDDKMEDE